MISDLVSQTVELPSGEIRMLQPREAAELPDDAAIEWAPIVPYWAVLWRSGLALAKAVDVTDLSGKRVIELGCGMALPSIVAARCGAEVIATDVDPVCLTLVRRNAEENGVELETAVFDWGAAEDLVARGPFDLVLGSDVLYERPGVALLLDLLPRLAPRALIADPGRTPGEVFFEQAEIRDWAVETQVGEPVDIHRIDLPHSPEPVSSSAAH